MIKSFRQNQFFIHQINILENLGKHQIFFWKLAWNKDFLKIWAKPSILKNFDFSRDFWRIFN